MGGLRQGIGLCQFFLSRCVIIFWYGQQTCCTRTFIVNVSCLAGSGSALTASSSGATTRSTAAGAFSDDAVAIATEIAENEVGVIFKHGNELLS